MRTSSCEKNKALKKSKEALEGETGLKEFRPKRGNRAKAEKK
jgi:hypothetical protein